MRFFLYIMLTIVLIFSCESQKSKYKVSDSDVENLNQFFLIEDSVLFEIPIEYSFSGIKDIAVFKNGMYLCVASKSFPILKFNFNDNSTHAIGKMGNGPSEYQFSPTRISCDSSGRVLAITDGPGFPNIYLFENDKFKKKLFIPQFIRISDLDILESNLVLSLSGQARTHLVCYDQELNLVWEKIKMPMDAKLLEIISTPFWGIQKINGGFITHMSYPLHIFEHSFINDSLFTKRILNKIKLKHFNFIKETFNGFPEKKEHAFNIYSSIGKLFWLTKKHEQYFGIYFFQHKETQKADFMFFHIDKQGFVSEFQFNSHFSVMNMIPVDDKIFTYRYYEKDGKLFYLFYTMAIRV